MYSFKNDLVELPLSSVWLMNALAEYKGRQELGKGETQDGKE